MEFEISFEFLKFGLYTIMLQALGKVAKCHGSADRQTLPFLLVNPSFCDKSLKQKEKEREKKGKKIEVLTL